MQGYVGQFAMKFDEEVWTILSKPKKVPCQVPKKDKKIVLL